MPSTSKAQARTMAAAAHNPGFAKKVGIKPAVAKEFNQADAKAGNLKKGSPLPKRKKKKIAHRGREFTMRY